MISPANVVIGSVAALVLIFMVKPILASKSSVYVESNVESYSNNQTNSKTKTDIRIESNGEIKEYHSEDGGNVTIESSDGKAKVNINNQVNSQSTNSQSSSSSIKTDINVSNERKANEKIKEVKKIRFEIFEFIKEKLSIFTFFDFSFFK